MADSRKYRSVQVLIARRKEVLMPQVLLHPEHLAVAELVAYQDRLVVAEAGHSLLRVEVVRDHLVVEAAAHLVEAEVVPGGKLVSSPVLQVD